MTDGLAEIKAKCDQYIGYGDGSIGMPEVHAILAFISTRTVDAIVEVERLEAAAGDAGDGGRTLRAEFEQLKADVSDFAQSCNDSYAKGMEAAAKVARETLLKHCDAAIKHDPACGDCPACRLADWVDLAICSSK